MADASDVFRERKLEIDALLEQAQELEAAAQDTELSIEETSCFYAHANNLRLRAICLDNPATRQTPETEPEPE